MKISKLLSFLLTGLTFYIDDEDGAGGAATVDDDAAAAIARGDLIDTPVDEAATAAAAAAVAAKNPMAKEDDEDEGTDEEKAAAAKKAAKPDTRIPLSRHKEMLDRAREERDALAAELAQQKQAAAARVTNASIAAQETKLEGLEKDYQKHVIDGDAEKAAAAMREIRHLERAINNEQSELKMVAYREAAVEEIRYNTIVDRLEAAFDEINPDSPSYDAAVTREMLEMQQAYQLKGLAPSAALQKAVKYVLEPLTKAQKTAVEVTPNVNKDEADAAAAATAAAAAKAARKAAAVGKALDAADKTPPNLTSVGKDSDAAGGGPLSAKDIMKLPQEEFRKIDEKTLSKLRGDEL